MKTETNFARSFVQAQQKKQAFAHARSLSESQRKLIFVYVSTPNGLATRFQFINGMDATEVAAAEGEHIATFDNGALILPC